MPPSACCRLSHRSLLLSNPSAAAAAFPQQSVLGGAARSDLELELLKPPAPGAASSAILARSGPVQARSGDWWEGHWW